MPISLYLHIPFCQVRCAYCDFNTYAGLDDLMVPYARALAKEIRMVGEAGQGAGERPVRLALGVCEGGSLRSGVVHTIFFGGGTPSLLPLNLHAEIFAALRESFELTPHCEITLEANPGTISRAYLEGLRELGINRLSFGVQSSHPHELRLLDRLHLFGDVVQAMTWARAVGFENINLDLIFAIPHQTMAMWQATLNRVLGLGPDHISCYALSLEHGTPMRAWVYRGLLPMPDPDLAAEMYEWASETLAANGYVQYEISNWSKKSSVQSPKSDRVTSDFGLTTSDLQHACRHNLQYWRNLPYLGFGAGAHGCAAGWRYSNVLAPAVYIARIGQGNAAELPFSPAVREKISITLGDAMNETMMLGLRLTREGVREQAFYDRFGVRLGEKYPKELKRLTQLGLVRWDGEGVRLTPRGRLLGNRVFREFV